MGVLPARELWEHERVELGKGFVIPTERVFRATEESAVALIGKGMASAMPKDRTYLYGFSR
jgi:hypothetical protein